MKINIWYYRNVGLKNGRVKSETAILTVCFMFLYVLLVYYFIFETFIIYICLSPHLIQTFIIL